MPAELSEAELDEYLLLSVPEAQWTAYTRELTADGLPLVETDDSGALVFHDEELAEWDRQARANAEAMDAKRG